MRKGLIATAVAVALFAVGAFAASFAVNADDIASGNTPVEACAEDVTITFEKPTLVSGVWVTEGATATFSGGPPSCDGEIAQLAVWVETDTGSGLENVAETTVNGTTAVFSFDAVEVEPLDEASVVVGGIVINGGE